MLSWGGEFCDDGHFGKLNIAEDSPSYKPGGFLIPMDFLDQIVDPKYIKEISNKDKTRLEWLSGQFTTVGQLHPGSIVYDRNYIRLKDGNHRYIVASRLGWTHLRVQLRRVENIATHGIPLNQILPKLMEVAYEI